MKCFRITQQEIKHQKNTGIDAWQMRWLYFRKLKFSNSHLDTISSDLDTSFYNVILIFAIARINNRGAKATQNN
ncbi:MAG: hypothetical protein BGO34_22090 [Bacteroidia bacterium 44-10]|nr:MAG: hypothetical protein BGO34_22090 [Bacteroidia bacterium 44-10]